MNLLEYVKILPENKRLVCWTGILFDNKHRCIRADRARLILVDRTTDKIFIRSLPGYRPAGVKPKETVKPEDYALIFNSEDQVVVIKPISSRAGRYALISNLLEGETYDKATNIWCKSLQDAVNLSNAQSETPAALDVENAENKTADESGIPGWVGHICRLFDTYTANEQVIETETFPVPKAYLISSQNALLFLYNKNEPAADPFIDDLGKYMYDANSYYGQGVLAIEATYPVGFWFLIPTNANQVTTNAIKINIQPPRG